MRIIRARIKTEQPERWVAMLAKDREYYNMHKNEKNTRARKWKSNNRAHLREYKKMLYRKNIQFKIAELLRNNLRQALRRYGEGKTFKSSFYGVDYKEIIEHIGAMPNDGQKYHIDHIRPLASFDLTKIEEIKKAFAPTNHQWLEATENIRKSDKWNGEG